MTFDSWEFAVFLPVVVGLYFTLRLRAQNLMLLAASYFFYGWWDWRFLGLLAFSTILDYGIGIAIENAGDDARRRKRLVTLSVLGNLGVLGTFKYLGWLTASAAQLLESVGLEANLPLLRIALPVGISFYTFQTMAYSIDVYRRRIPACRDFPLYALYTSYFPQLVAGPIERAERLLPQLATRRVVDNRRFAAGAFLVLRGLFKKVALSDALAPLIDSYYGAPETHEPALLWVGTYYFLFQVYFDFSGYSDVARGTSKILGIDLVLNFRQPFFAAGFRDFWRRWHISLLGWFRDYVYIPLGGSRGSLLGNCRNLVLSMTLAGLWHGAAWGMLIWGFLNGLIVAIETWGAKRYGWAPIANAATPGRALVVRVVSAFIAVHGICFYLVFFRAPTFEHAIAYYAGMLRTLTDLPSLVPRFGLTAFYFGVILVMDLPAERRGSDTAMLQWPLPFRALAIAVMLLFLVLWGRGSDVPFIYFRF